MENSRLFHLMYLPVLLIISSYSRMQPRFLLLLQTLEESSTRRKNLVSLSSELNRVS